jgi:glycerophosphoryl diester phosphodiesterase
LLFAGCSLAAQTGPPLKRAHSHNDYEHHRPLLDALNQGFASVEADIHLKAGEILVGHDPEDLRPARTLETLYLRPLKERMGKNQRIFSDGPPLILLVDIKTDAAATYTALKLVLERYAAMLTRFEGDQIITNAVTVILSGNRPREQLLSEASRYAAFDGRLADLGKGLPISFMPLVSDNWNNHFTWKGQGTLAEAERTKLKGIVAQAHRENRALRFWATPDTQAAWQELAAAGVDLINTDDLEGLAAFLRKGVQR